MLLMIDEAHNTVNGRKNKNIFIKFKYPHVRSCNDVIS